MYADATSDHVGTALKAVSDPRPLEQITPMIEDLARMNLAIDAFLSRFNGPSPTATVSADPQPSGYRSEIDRLRATVTETGALVDALTRLG